MSTVVSGRGRNCAKVNLVAVGPCVNACLESALEVQTGVAGCCCPYGRWPVVMQRWHSGRTANGRAGKLNRQHMPERHSIWGVIGSIRSLEVQGSTTDLFILH